MRIPRTDLDEKIGANITNVRIHNGLSQTELGKIVGVSFQQIQKYETGKNKISASTLYIIGKSLFPEYSVGDIMEYFYKT